MEMLNFADDTYQLTVNVENILFEGVWEMPEGVSLNTYIVKGEKTAIIDGFCGWDGVPETLFDFLGKIDVDPKKIEYLVVNHMEPDHSGWIEEFKKINDKFTILCSEKAKDLLATFYGQTENVVSVKEGDTLDLGNGHVLEFYTIPNVHWPDTIATFDKSTEVLFSCDAFGSFGKLSEKKFAEDFTPVQLESYERETIRYYSNVLASFTSPVKKAVAKCLELPVKIVAPGHGLMWKDAEKIMKAYDDYADYQKGKAREEITFIWSSMYGMTKKAAKHVEKILLESDIKVHIHEVPKESWGTVLTSAWTSTGIIVGMPTYEYKMFPPMASTLDELGRKKVINRKAFRFGSYGWSGGAQRELDEIMERTKMNWEFIEPVEFAGSPTEEDLKLIETRVKELIALVKDSFKSE